MLDDVTLLYSTICVRVRSWTGVRNPQGRNSHAPSVSEYNLTSAAVLVGRLEPRVREACEVRLARETQAYRLSCYTSHVTYRHMRSHRAASLWCDAMFYLSCFGARHAAETLALRASLGPRPEHAVRDEAPPCKRSKAYLCCDIGLRVPVLNCTV